MPKFDIRQIYAAKYNYSGGTVSYTDRTKVGDSMSVDMTLNFGEGRVYAEGALHTFKKQINGGTMSIAVADISKAAQQLMFNAFETTRSSKTGLKYTTESLPSYVGVTFIAYEDNKGTTKYIPFFVAKASFGPPSYKFTTVNGNTITFDTPTISGEFMRDDGTGLIYEIGDAQTTLADAEAYCAACMPTG